jgi:beta-lactamase superfamily II metal-dependent hydrolase
MMNYKVFDVGDALFSVITNKNEKSVLDFGYSNHNYISTISNIEYQDAETFIISHFHLDHYKIFFLTTCDNLNIKKLIIPNLPKDEEVRESLIAFMATELYFLGEQTGIYEADLLNIIRRKNQFDFEVERKSRNDNFNASGVDYRVIWPDSNYLSRKATILKALGKFNKVCDENSDFKKFYDDVSSSGFWESQKKTLEDTKEKSYKIELSREQKDLLKSANKSLIQVANDICLAFESKGKELLFLGDLSDNALDELFKLDFNEKVSFNAILSAHHGTHSSINRKWKNIKSSVVITSGGRQRIRKFRGAYFLCSFRQHHTNCNGTFNLTQYNRDNTFNKLGI